MKVKTLIVDDEKHCIESLKSHLKSYEFINIVGEVNSAEEALAYLQHHSVELLFLDIEMDGMDGLSLAKKVENAYPEMLIIFVTGHVGFALDGYEAHPVDFLTKPINPMRLERAMEKVKELKKEVKVIKDAKIGLNVAGGIQMILISDVLYIEKKGRKIYVCCNDGEKYDTRETMKRLEEMLAPFGFYRSHQSFLVPLQRIKAIHPDSFSRSHTIMLKGSDNPVPLSRNNYNELKGIMLKEAADLNIH
ncbi:response regulator transcription factor [Sporosarcina sp. Sa2YVA2]|uniref:Response regulator transcription factor n=1 Tax=Sporosarcina quadrami TaxID=2762234 RepID=A0ABR8U851_9BACL|nr:LytTR family DNA-binding domain-containing protein [Sporosarcina quadrami]MBD7984220.1 response regulator transcription factor [Sporosarcina quadrami]